MKASELINALASAYFERIESLPAPLSNKLKGLRSMQSVMLHTKSKKAFYEIVNVMLQPLDEPVYFESCNDVMRQDDKSVVINITAGMGIELDPDTHLELLGFMDSPSFNACAFGAAFAKKIEGEIKRIKRLNNSQTQCYYSLV